jgi:DEAD/DEAH box helicase domain-containing protein
VATRTRSTPWQGLLDAGRGEQLVAQSREGARPGEPVALPEERLHPAFALALRGAGVEHLWSHQAETLESALDRGHTIVTTGTASGKSLAFNLPVLDVLARDPRARALYLYPTKALAQDQARALATLRAPFLRPAIYDGDTPREERRAIRRRSNLILTNPDMLNVSVLPHHRGWGDVLANLAFIVVDEAHTYRGVFGSHVANVLRRLRRLANAYGTEPRFVLASATIANPVELAERLTGLDFELVERDGAPRAERQIAMWNPPLLDEAKGTRVSSLSEGAGLLADLVERGARTICFLRSRRGVELIQRFTRLCEGV